MTGLTISQVARRAGLRPSALRYYEDAGVLPAAVRVNGHRRYSPEILQRLDLLRFAQQAGFTLAEIKMLFGRMGGDAPLSARWQRLARAKLEELDALTRQIAVMRHALQLGLECGCVRLEDCHLSPRDLAPEGRKASSCC